MEAPLKVEESEYPWRNSCDSCTWWKIFIMIWS